MDVPTLKTRPTLSQWVTDYWNGFQILSGSRASHQGGIGPIPLSEIVAYMEATYLRDVDERLLFIRMIQSLDTVYVKHVNDKVARNAKAERAKAQRKPRTR